MTFGALGKCPDCKQGDIYNSHGKYKCTGDVDAFARCEWHGTEDEIERSEWKIPSDLADE